MNKYVRLRIERMIINQLKKAPKIIKQELKDPDMCICVQNLIDDLVDEFWPDVEDEVLFQLRLKLNQPALLTPPKPEYSMYCWCCLKFRGWFRYNYDPVDRSIWRQFKNVWYWVFFLIEAIPYFAIQAVFKLIWWILMDKSDTFQNVKFILLFKELQFFTLGCLGGLIGYIQYFRCAVFNRGADSSELTDCAVAGSFNNFAYILEIAGFVLQIVLIWSSYFILPFTKAKGLPNFRLKQKELKNGVEDSSRELGCCSCAKGGRLGCFMLWELFTTIFVVGLGLLLVFALGQKEEVAIRASVYFCKTIYGLLSFPFLVFAAKPLASLLTKSKPTRYDK